MIEENVKKLLEKLKAGNNLGEEVTLVAATKTRTPEEIDLALRAGIRDIGENKVQEFRDKFDLIHGGNRHFIGHLQTNKVKYLIGKTCLIHSVDSDQLAQEIATRSERAGIKTNILIEINIGSEETKSGFPLALGLEKARKFSSLTGLCVQGFMAMLPQSDNQAYLSMLCDQMRDLFDRAKSEIGGIVHLSMGMSGDYELCLAHGSNMIRLGTAIFGERNYAKTAP